MYSNCQVWSSNMTRELNGSHGPGSHGSGSSCVARGLESRSPGMMKCEVGLYSFSNWEDTGAVTQVAKPSCPTQTELQENQTRIIPPTCGHVDLLWTCALREKISGQHEVLFPLCESLYSADQNFWPEIHLTLTLYSGSRWSAPLAHTLHRKKMPDNTRSQAEHCQVMVSQKLGQKGSIIVLCMIGFKLERASTSCTKRASFTTGGHF